MTKTKQAKQSRDRSRKRGEGEIYGVIDDLIAPAFARWIAEQREHARNNNGKAGACKGKQSSGGNSEKQDETGIKL
jgi:hypothetical protein